MDFGFLLLEVVSGGVGGEGGGGGAGGFGCDFVIILFEFASELAEIRVVLVELVAVADDLADVGVELGGGNVDLAFQVLLDGLQVHGFLDDLEVVGNA